jgi:ribonuclease E
VQAPVEIANYLLNEKRGALREIEQRHDAPILIVADEQLHTPHYEVTRLRENELDEESSKPSYRRGTPRKVATIALTKANLNVPPPAAVTNVRPAQPAPIREPRPEPAPTPVAAQPAPSPATGGFVGWLKSLFGGAEETSASSSSRSREDQRDHRTERTTGRRDGRGNPQGQGGRDAARRDEPRRSAQASPQQNAQPAKSKSSGGQKKTRGRRGQDAERKPVKAAADAATAMDERQDPAAHADEAARQAKQPAAAGSDAGMSEDDVRKPATGSVSSQSPDVQAAATSDPHRPPESSTQTSVTDGNGDEAGSGNARRRRGRRGGRRRRRGGADGNAAESSGLDDASSAEDATPADRSQPEFDFDDGGEQAVAKRKPRAPRQKPAVEPESSDATAPATAGPVQPLAATDNTTSAPTVSAPEDANLVDPSIDQSTAAERSRDMAEAARTDQAPEAAIAPPDVDETVPYPVADASRTDPAASAPRILRDNEDLVPAAPSEEPRTAQAVGYQPPSGNASPESSAPVPEPVRFAVTTDAPQAPRTGVAPSRGLFDTAATPDAPTSPAEAAAEALAESFADEEGSEDPETIRSS